VKTENEEITMKREQSSRLAQGRESRLGSAAIDFSIARKDNQAVTAALPGQSTGDGTSNFYSRFRDA
jgi:hypothetical protein